MRDILKMTNFMDQGNYMMKIQDKSYYKDGFMRVIIKDMLANRHLIIQILSTIKTKQFN